MGYGMKHYLKKFTLIVIVVFIDCSI